jgi:hypothetical protein
MDFNKPSSTITATWLAGLTIAFLWAVYSWLGVWKPPPPELVSLSSTLGAGIVGYFKKETVYPEGWKGNG